VSKRSESPWEDMGKSLQEEIDGDAPIIGSELFGEKWPGTSNIPDTRAAGIIQDAYARGDRPFLQHLAEQGPEQFLRVWKNLGGTVPDPNAPPGQQVT
jgi:hypothetical protein